MSKPRGKVGILCACAAFLFITPSNCMAFLFGRASERKAESFLEEMRMGFEKGDCRAVLELSRTLLNERPSAAIREQAYSYMGRCYESQGLPDRAISVYKLANGLYPDNDFFYKRLAVIYLAAGFYENAVPLFEKLIKDRSDDIEANAGLAGAYASLGFLSKAKTYYSRAAILGDFKDYALLNEYALAMVRKRDWEEALLITGYARILRPRDAGLCRIMARIAAGSGDYKKAAEHMRSALQLEPSNREFTLEKAVMELLGGESTAALKTVSSPDLAGEPAALLVKGMVLYKKGDKKAAAEDIGRAARTGSPFVAGFAAALLKNF